MIMMRTKFQNQGNCFIVNSFPYMEFRKICLLLYFNEMYPVEQNNIFR